jgi:alpha-glucoside transport system permease protein
MTTIARPIAVPIKSRESVSTRLVEFTSKSPVHLALILISVVWLVPTVGLFVTSLRAPNDIATSGWWLAFFNWRFTPENYVRVLGTSTRGETLWPNVLNSFIITIPSTILPVFIGAMAAYAFAWLSFRWRDTIFMVVIGLLIIPLQMTFVPILQLYFDALGPFKGLAGLAGIDSSSIPRIAVSASFVGLWLAHTAYGLPFAIFLLRSFFAGLPRDLFEAAKIDGSTELGIFIRIVLPLSVPALAALTIFQFLGVWNDLLVALVFAQNPTLQPLTVGIKSMLTTYGPEWDILSAGAFITMAVPMIVFFSLQRYFVRGLLTGSVKT